MVVGKGKCEISGVYGFGSRCRIPILRDTEVNRGGKMRQTRKSHNFSLRALFPPIPQLLPHNIHRLNAKFESDRLCLGLLERSANRPTMFSSIALRGMGMLTKKIQLPPARSKCEVLNDHGRAVWATLQVKHNRYLSTANSMVLQGEYREQPWI